MHFRNAETGEWIESAPEIIITNNGAIGHGAPHQVNFSVNINSPVGVEVRTPDNQQLKLRILGMAFYDFIKRTNVLIAEIQDSDGQLIGANQVIYTNAFTDFQADVRYTYSKSGIEQDVILRTMPPLPESFGMNPDSTRLLLLTELIDPPANVQTIQHIRRGWTDAKVDKTISFGAMTIGQGTAFSLGQDADGPQHGGVPVEKHYEVLEGRTFIIEEISFRRLVPLLRNLQASVEPRTGLGAPASLLASSTPRSTLASPSVRGILSRNLLLPPVKTASASPKGSPQFAALRAPRSALEPPGLVLDFNLVNATNMVLQGDTTYVVASNATVNLSGNSVIEGGCVVKFDRGARINFLGPVQCLTGPYRPAVFTCVDDDSAGTQVATSTHTPTGRYAAYALGLGAGGDLKYLNVRYAKEAVCCENSDYTVSHSQFLFCDVGLHSEMANFTNCNILMYQVATNYYGAYFNGRIEHLTSDQASTLAADPNFEYMEWCQGLPSSTLVLVNSLTASITNGYGFPFVTNGLPAITTDHVRDFPTSLGLFQTVGAGSHYLCDGSTNRNAGTTNISPAILADLKKKTTYPPIDLSVSNIVEDTTLSPQAGRETGATDLGYAYDPLDFAIKALTVTSATLTINPGTALGFYGSDCEGLTLMHGAQLITGGSPTDPSRLVWYNVVQEQATTNWIAAYPGIILTCGEMFSYPAPIVNCRFTDFSRISGEHIGYGADGLGGNWSFRDCQFNGGTITFEGPDGTYDAFTVGLTNCLFERVSVVMIGMVPPFEIEAHNNLFWNGSLALDDFDTSGEFTSRLKFTDNLFDRTSITQTTNVTVTASYNAFITNCDRLIPTNSHDLILTNTDFVWGPLGNYYYPTNGGMLSHLINAGSTNADAVGLYHQTVVTNLVGGFEIPETNSIVDIGWHRVAVDTNGNPRDTDGDGLPDYFENTAGNGVYTAGDLSDWQHADTDGDRIPDGWAFKYFGHPTGQASDHSRAQDDYDGDGTSNLAEYQNVTDPNKIQFYTLFDNLRVSGTTATGMVTVLAGVPSKIAVLVDNTNFTSAIWTDYNSDFTANLGSGSGPHSVYVGLKGRAEDSQQTWAGYALVRDTISPVIVITNPAPGVVYQPLLQLEGYCTKPLAAVRYDLTNAVGGFTDLEGHVVKQFVDTNTFEITTNWLACVDIGLTAGTNRLTLRTTDQAGNVSTNSYEYIFVYPTNAPTVALIWPHDGDYLGTTNFTARGRVSDPTAQVTAQIIGGGATNTTVAIVERDGKFWVEDLPLATGTNFIALTVADVGTNTTITNFTVIQSSVELTITALDSETLNDPFITVTGTISTNDCKVWVNGVEVTNVSGGDWSVEGVPVNAGGTAVVQARAIPTSDNGGNGTGGSGGQSASFDNPGNPNSSQSITAEADKDKNSEVVLIHYHKNRVWLSIQRAAPHADASIKTGIKWDRNEPGFWWQDDCHCNDVASDDYYFFWFKETWDAKGNGEHRYFEDRGHQGEVCDVHTPYYSFSFSQSDSWPGEFCAVVGYRFYLIYDEVVFRMAKTLYELHTGGKGVAQRENLFVGTTSAQGVGNAFWPEASDDQKAFDIAPTNIVLGVLGRLGSDGRAYKVLPDNSTYDITPAVAGNPYYTYATPVAPKHKLRILANGADTEAEYPPNTPVFIVGQFVPFTPDWNPTPPDIASKTYKWQFNGNYLNDTNPPSCDYCSANYFRNSNLLTNETPQNWWVSGSFDFPASYPVQLKESLTFSNGQSAVVMAYGGIQMYRPNGKISASTTRVTVISNLLWFCDLDVADGIIFSNTLAIPTNFSGSTNWAQVLFSINVVFQGANSTNYVRHQNGADPYGDYPIPYGEFLEGTHIPADSPAEVLPNSGYVRCERSDSFRMWMMFEPPGGIWVPLRAVDWRWHGIATNGPSGWGLASSPDDHTVNPPDFPTENYPLWNSDVHSYHYVPPRP